MMYSITKVAEIAKVSLKTLRHYDKIGLLKPTQRKESGYRYYSRFDLIKLQQILFYKELDFPLKDILSIMNDTEFSPLDELKNQKEQLYKKIERFEKLINTIEKTINSIENKMENEIMLSDEELYDGFSKEQAESYKIEAREKWGADLVKESEMRIKKLGKDGWKLLKEKGEKITQELARLMDKYPEHPDVQDQVAEYHDYLNHFYTVTPEIYQSLGKMYVEDSRFTAHYEKYREGLAEFLSKAINYYVSEGIWKKKRKV